MEDKFIELRILTGLIVSTEYLQQIRKSWDPKLMESSILKKMSGWCIDYFDKYNHAPNVEIESIFKKQTRNLKEQEVEDIEDILADLSDEYERADKFNVKYLLDQTIEYFEERNLSAFAESILGQLENGELSDAKTSAVSYTNPIKVSDENLDFANEEVLGAVDVAFENANCPVVKYPRALGKFLNDQLVRNSFVAFMAPEKRGKTFLLLDMSIRAAKQHSNVAFFQAGDMSQGQQIRRIAIHLNKKSDKEKYCVSHYEPVRDCIKNQMDDCDLPEREGRGEVFEGAEKDFFREQISMTDLIIEYKANRNHKTCYNCSKFWTNKYGTPWIQKIPAVRPLTPAEAKRSIKELFIKRKLGFKLSTHPTKTLTVSEIDNILSRWEREDGFVADLIIVDYADILAPEVRVEFRHQENDKWMRLRGLSQKRNALVVTVTQTDADSYERNTLSSKNFSEDKRKFGHVTAIWGLNQDKAGREKEIGLMRINEIFIREDRFSVKNYITVLQNLQRGQPCLSSY